MVDLAGCSHGGIYSVNANRVRVDFSSNVNPLGISKAVLRTIRRKIYSLSATYPDPECKDLKESLCDYLKIHPDCINLGNGATELIHIFARVFAANKVIIPCPTFCEYELASRRVGAKIVSVPLRKMELDEEQLIEKAKGSDVVFLCNPNNPTSLLYRRSLKKIINGIDSSTKILVDECFIELINEPDRFTMIKYLNEFDNLVILRSLTKSFGLAGLRLGYCVSCPKLAKKFNNCRVSWNVNGIAQRAGIAALKDLRHLTIARKVIKKEREFMRVGMERRMKNFFPLKSDANFFLIRLSSNKFSTEVRDYLLLKNGILVRDCSTFLGMGSRFIRVAIKTHKENLILMNALEAIDN
jgi:threonine-phosphate decarboxylase